MKKVENMNDKELDNFIKKTISESNFSHDLIDEEENQSSNLNIKKKIEKISETYEENVEENEENNNFQNNNENDEVTEKENISDII